MNRLILISILMLSFLSPLAAQSDYRSRIAVIPLVNGTSREQYNPLCSTITETVSLVLQFLKDYKLVDEEDIDLTRLGETVGEDLTALKSTAEQEGVDEIVFGRMEESDGKFLFSISLFNVDAGRITNNQSVEAESVLDVFDAGDELTEGLIAQLSDVTIAFGSIELVQKAGKGNYTVNLDGYPLRNPEKTFRKVLNGSYEIAITQKRLTGMETVFLERIEVTEGKKSIVEFVIPPGSSEEFEWMDERGAALLSLGRDEEDFDRFMEELTLFQTRTLALEYDAELEGLRDSYMKKAGELASGTLRNRMEAVDASFYEKNVNFGDVLKDYEDLSAFVKTSYDYRILESGETAVFSEPQKIQSDGGSRVSFLAYGPDGYNALYIWNRVDDSILSRPVSGSALQRFSGDFYLTSRQIVLWEPGESQVEILDHQLETKDHMPVPDLPEGGDGIKLALSPEDQLYLISSETIRVVDMTREYDEEGKLLPPDRYYSTEETLAAALADEKSPVGDLFFDSAGYLNAFYPSVGMLYIFDQRGNLLKKVHLPESEPESRIAVDDTGFLYMSLYKQNSLVKYTQSGELISSIGRYGSNPGEFSLPAGVALSSDGFLFVSDSYNGRIQSMEALTVPIVYPEVARYGEDLDRRIDRSNIAVLKDRGAKDDIGWKNHLGNLLGTTVALGSTFGFILAGDYFGNNWANAVYENEVSDDGGGGSIRGNETGQRSMDIFSFASFGAAAGFATSTLLGLGLDSTLSRYNRKQIQSLDMDKEYEIDPDRYRSIRRTSQIGVWTGIVPPVLGALVFTGMVANEFDGVEMWAGYVIMGSIISPPIFSHLHAGRFSPGLLGAGLVADLLAVWGFMELTSSDGTGMSGWHWQPEDYSIGNKDTMNTGRAMDRSFEFTGVYLLAAAFGVRIAAGIYDARNGWIYTNNYNRYKAVRERRKPVESSGLDVNVLPYIHPTGRLGMAMSFRF